MGLLHILFASLLQLATLALDIVGFFLWVRLVSFFRPFPLLRAFDQAGAPLIDPLATFVQRMLPTELRSVDPAGDRLAIALTLLAVGLCLLLLSSAGRMLAIPL